ncbi:hypothetical protein [Plantibacter sp. YIM 135347]|uniref:hypothetical protein n=1 Tax=Plantibacter sp. YIM 135347 TaxID=3423919 RepID=UPI003D34B8FF
MPLFPWLRRGAALRASRRMASGRAPDRLSKHADLASVIPGDAFVADDLEGPDERSAAAARPAHGDVQSDRIALFREHSALWLIGVESPIAVARSAADVLGGDLDTPSLRAVAGLQSTSDWWEVRIPLGLAWEELGSPLPPDGSDELTVLALRAQCRRFLDGRLTAPSLASWAHSVAGHDGPTAAQQLVQLDDDIDTGTLPAVRCASSDLQTVTKQLVERFLIETDETVGTVHRNVPPVV